MSENLKTIPFCKYQGTGNDFVVIDNRETCYLTRKDVELVKQLCDRRFGIGADGLILLQNKEGFDFEMVYFNSDGNESSMCGNGGRCIVAFAKSLAIIEQTCRFLAIDGTHEAVIHNNGWVDLKMGDVDAVEKGEDYFILDTGSPHYVIFVEDLSDINVYDSGQVIRYSERFRKEGINVNFMEKNGEGISVATYERGVEGETLSCGTGVTAAAIAASILQHNGLKKNEIAIETKGGHLKVKLEKENGRFRNIWLCGPAVKVFEGTLVFPASGTEFTAGFCNMPHAERRNIYPQTFLTALIMALFAAFVPIVILTHPGAPKLPTGLTMIPSSNIFPSNSNSSIPGLTIKKFPCDFQ